MLLVVVMIFLQNLSLSQSEKKIHSLSLDAFLTLSLALSGLAGIQSTSETDTAAALAE